jgi:hypothetical protein
VELGRKVRSARIEIKPDYRFILGVVLDPFPNRSERLPTSQIRVPPSQRVVRDLRNRTAQDTPADTQPLGNIEGDRCFFQAFAPDSSEADLLSSMPSSIHLGLRRTCDTETPISRWTGLPNRHPIHLDSPQMVLAENSAESSIESDQRGWLRGVVATNPDRRAELPDLVC